MNKELTTDFAIALSRNGFFYIKNKKTHQYLLRNREVAEYRDIGEGVNGWFETYEEAEAILLEYKNGTRS